MLHHRLGSHWGELLYRAVAALGVVTLTATGAPAQAGGDYFKITVLDQDTGRGVPLVELRSTNEVAFYTDSNGIAAIAEPGFWDQEVYFHIRSHGYDYPKDGFGYSGAKLRVTRGGSAELKVKRLNVAERLYRVTGEGIYRDSLLVGQPVPLAEPVLAGQVTGQDSVLATPYRGRIFWIWGDTNRPSYPLGNFGVSGATSEWPPPKGTGLEPGVGVNLRYFVNESGFSRPMIPAEAVPGPGPKWLGGLVTIRDKNGEPQLIAKYVRMKSLGETLERGLVRFDDESASFRRLVQFDLDAPLYLDGHPFRATVGDTDYFYCGYSVPYAVRVRADLEHLSDPAAYEGFSCLSEGGRYEKSNTKLDRDAAGILRYGWKRDTPPLTFDEQEELIKAGKMSRTEAWLHLQDVETGQMVRPHAGSVRWNAYRNRWVMIVEQAFGSSNLGEVWFAEADTPLGPWVYARKVVTHDKYTFYNPVHHEFFDEDGGRLIYFEGTYSELFSGSAVKTPRYDYNQIMYRLALDDPRLNLPVPVYEGPMNRLVLGEELAASRSWSEAQRIAFLALPPSRRADGMIPIYDPRESGRFRLSTDPRAGDAVKKPQPLFLALPAKTTAVQAPVVPLYEYRGRSNPAARRYSTDPELSDDGWVRAPEPLCHVWASPTPNLLIDPGVAAHETE